MIAISLTQAHRQGIYLQNKGGRKSFSSQEYRKEANGQTLAGKRSPDLGDV
jgi:hypothetical protein